MAVFVGNNAVPPAYQFAVLGPYGKTDATKVTLQQLAQLAPSARSERFACVAKITNINTSFDWYYLSCPECHHKASENKDKTSCTFDSCPRDVVEPIPWYHFGVQVIDLTGDAEFVFLGRQAELAVGLKAAELAADEDPASEDAPPQLLQLIGKTFMFIVWVKQMTGYAND